MTPIDEANPEADLSVGIPEIDEEHRRFFSHINLLDVALTLSGGITGIRHIMDQLVEQAIQHFSHEEEMFNRIGFPDVEAHSNIHAKITDELIKLKQLFDTAVLGAEHAEIGKRIRELLMHHVIEHDMKYRDFLHHYRLIPI